MRQTVEWPDLDATSKLLISLVGQRQRLFRFEHRHDCVDGRIDLLDLLQKRAHDLTGRSFLGPDLGRQFSRRGIANLGKRHTVDSSHKATANLIGQHHPTIRQTKSVNGPVDQSLLVQHPDLFTELLLERNTVSGRKFAGIDTLIEQP